MAVTQIGWICFRLSKWEWSFLQWKKKKKPVGIILYELCAQLSYWPIESALSVGFPGTAFHAGFGVFSSFQPRNSGRMAFLILKWHLDSSCILDAVEIMEFRSSYPNHSSLWFPAFFCGSLLVWTEHVGISKCVWPRGILITWGSVNIWCGNRHSNWTASSDTRVMSQFRQLNWQTMIPFLYNRSLLPF